MSYKKNQSQNLSHFCHMRFFWCIGHNLSHQLNTVIHTFSHLAQLMNFYVVECLHFCR
nr:MAG TPA: hypothetical protein [Caudoviricetes sp.]